MYIQYVAMCVYIYIYIYIHTIRRERPRAAGWRANEASGRRARVISRPKLRKIFACMYMYIYIIHMYIYIYIYIYNYN